MFTLTTPARGELTVVELADPTAGAGEVLVRVHAASVNPIDQMVVGGALHEAGLITHDGALGLGWDLVGTVEATGDDVDAWAVGDRVAALLPGFDQPVGAISEYAVVPASSLASVPGALDDVSAAGVGMNALTAAQALDLLGAPAGRSLLVTGAAGSVGGFAVELAVAAGWEVTGLARETDRDFVSRAGAKLITDLARGPEYDAVLDAAPLQLDADLFAGALVPALVEGGTLISVLGAFPVPVLVGRTALAVMVQPDGARHSELLGLAVAGTLTSRVAGTFPLADAAAAFGAYGPGGRGRWLLLP